MAPVPVPATVPGPRRAVAAALKWVGLRPQVDPLTGRVTEDPHSFGASPADQAALELALQLGERWGMPVTAVTAGPPGAAELLRECLAAGARRAVRVALPAGAASAAVADALAPALAGCTVVCCGDASLDRGTGSVPAFLADRLDAAQGLGLVTVEPAAPGVLRGGRRLDGGRRECIVLREPAVCSVEPHVRRLRRASLAGVLAARQAAVEVVTPDVDPRGDHDAPRVVRVRPYRPRARALHSPDPGLTARERVLALTGGPAGATTARVVRSGPREAADELMDFLHTHGYLP
ncbi:MAG: mycofactocin-associated electron transfer flavoprotein beta subunit [Carbonactinosporaceae bacterium]